MKTNRVAEIRSGKIKVSSLNGAVIKASYTTLGGEEYPTGYVEIRNASKDEKEAFIEKQKVALLIGDDDTPMSELMAGEIRDIKTTLDTVSFKVYLGSDVKSNQGFTTGNSYKNILYNLATKAGKTIMNMPALGTPPKHNGISVSGPALKSIGRILGDLGMSCTLHGDDLYIINKESEPSNVYKLTSDNGLINVLKNGDIEGGYKVQSEPIAFLKKGDFAKISHSSFNGTIRITDFEVSLGDKWEALYYGGAL